MVEQHEPLSEISQHLTQVVRRLESACVAAGRPANAAQLIAVSKGADLPKLREAIAAGQRQFGESYVQEALPKLAALAGADLTWHFIGPMQSNKTRAIATHFDWVHSVDRLKIAQRLSEQRPLAAPPLQVCVQVNVSAESSKSGCSPDQLMDLCVAVATLPRLRLRGLMAIPQPVAAGGDARAPFRTLRALFDEVQVRLGPQIDTLSAGMSDDLEAAIAEGATVVRVGSAIFGEREQR